MYGVILQTPARRFLRKLDTNVQKRIINKLKELKVNPRLGKPLTANLAGSWSLRVGNYRAIYTIKDSELIVLVLDIGHRKKIY